MIYHTKSQQVKAIRWHKMGDHPNVVPVVPFRVEGNKIVATPGGNIYYNSQDYWPGIEQTHGMLIDNGPRRTQSVVAPGDWIVYDGATDHTMVVPHERFCNEYEPVLEQSDSKDARAGQTAISLFAAASDLADAEATAFGLISLEEMREIGRIALALRQLADKLKVPSGRR